MSAPHQIQSAVLLGHIASQIQFHVDFLESQHYMSPEDAATMKEIISRLPIQTTVATTTTQVSVRAVPPAPLPSKGASTYVRSIWGYNEDGREANDLSFAAGETIEVISEKNADWWLGKARGKEGLFPSNHVEKIESTVPAPEGTRAYRPFGAALHGTDTPPPNGAGVNSIGLQQTSGQAEKKNKFGGLGNTMAHSAAGGVGFGAGAAIGGGLVRAIF